MAQMKNSLALKTVYRFSRRLNENIKRMSNETLTLTQTILNFIIQRLVFIASN